MLVLAAAMTLVLLWAGLALALVDMQRTTAAIEARAAIANRQALLVTQIETLLARQTAPSQRASLALQARLKAYLATLAAERAMSGHDLMFSPADDAREAANAAELAGLINGPLDPPSLEQASTLASSIANRELAEAQTAAGALQDAWQRLILLLWLAMAGLAVISTAVGLLVWRHIVKPLRALAGAVDAVARGAGLAPLRLEGPDEIHRLIGGFNHMAANVDAQAARRTAALEAALSRLADIESRRRLFLSKIGHELRTPLTVMRAEAELALRSGSSGPVLHDALGSIIDSGSFMQRRLDDLLALARAESGALGLIMAPNDLAAIARDAVRRTASYARLAMIDLEIGSLPAHLPVIGDADRLFQAIAAVIDNSLKFSPPGAAVLVSGAAEAGWAVISVADQGPGVTEDEIAAIFEPYVQGEAGRSHGGSGLGLALARWIADAHGGSISAQAGHGGEGLCVSIRLPLKG